MMKKNVLFLCTGNSCRSIMAEALINAKLGKFIAAQSSGVKATSRVNPTAQALLKKQGLWREEYHSKVIETVLDTSYDLVVTLCDNAKETCPIFPETTKTIHIGFEDPSGKADEEYVKTLERINANLLPIIKKEFGL